jgi:hypothetical protein
VASAASFSLNAAQALTMASLTLAVVQEPPEPGASGRSLSPSSKVTRSTGSPRASAATWVKMV